MEVIIFASGVHCYHHHSSVVHPPVQTPKKPWVLSITPSANCNPHIQRFVFFIVAGDFSQANIKTVLPHFHQYVSFSTRGVNTLDRDGSTATSMSPVLWTSAASWDLSHLPTAVAMLVAQFQVTDRRVNFFSSIMLYCEVFLFPNMSIRMNLLSSQCTVCHTWLEVGYLGGLGRSTDEPFNKHRPSTYPETPFRQDSIRSWE